MLKTQSLDSELRTVWRESVDLHMRSRLSGASLPLTAYTILTMLKMQLHIDQVFGDQLSSIARCDCGEVNIENLHTSTGFRKGTH